MANSFPMRVWTGLLADGHRERMKMSIWTYLWLIGKVTKEEDGVGYVLGGNSIRTIDIAKELKTSIRTIERELERLEKEGYIKIERDRYKIKIFILKSKKFKWDIPDNDTSVAINSNNDNSAEYNDTSVAYNDTSVVMPPDLSSNDKGSLVGYNRDRIKNRIDNTSIDNLTTKKQEKGKDVFNKEESFSQFWVLYPRKVAKQQAIKAWNKLKPNKELVNEILKAVETQKQSKGWLKDDGQFIPHPATYINGRRWEDEVEEVEDWRD